MSAILKEVEDMTCPRCGSDKIRVMVKSPVGDAWEVYVCETCVYSWRSTENPDIHEKFKLNPEEIPELQVIPPVPPLD
ncbi:MAG: non-oxidative hydroxyarylic acid decarboxylases subunit D [Clostridium sp.]|nr:MULTISPECIES: non-oxidative hydroxyarylic acid decarboxylases subunit D [Clostridia]MDU7709249.1 non-oxidative hydroxyarylic acid decarboxylases subunit D [Clostridium sp.]MEE0199880.1 non-oxidative hydroxyarylic acid decarboxylases subunit D [Muricomes sp.]